MATKPMAVEKIDVWATSAKLSADHRPNGLVKDIRVELRKLLEDAKHLKAAASE
jgi:hypothetical protein